MTATFLALGLFLLLLSAWIKAVESGFFRRLNAWFGGLDKGVRFAFFVAVLAGMCFSQKPGTGGAGMFGIHLDGVSTGTLSGIASSGETGGENPPGGSGDEDPGNENPGDDGPGSGGGDEDPPPGEPGGEDGETPVPPAAGTVAAWHETMADTDEDGLCDGVELSGLLPVYEGTDEFAFRFTLERQGRSVMWPYSVSSAVQRLELGEFYFPFGGEVYSNLWISASGLMTFGQPLNRRTPLMYPLDGEGKERLQAAVPQVAFLQGTNNLYTALGSDIRLEASEAGRRRLTFEKIYLGENTNVWVDALIELYDDGLIRLGWQRSDGGIINQEHTVGWQVRGGGVTLGALPSGSLISLRPFTPTDPENPDSDADGVSDYDELVVYHSNPNARDSDVDGDGVPDTVEWLLGTDPRNAASVPSRDDWLTALEDSDGDGFSDYVERWLGTSPSEASSYPGRETWGSVVFTVSVPESVSGGPWALALGEIVIPVFSGSSFSLTVPVRWGEVIEPVWSGDGPEGAVFSVLSAPGSLALTHDSAGFRFAAGALTVGPVIREKTPGYRGTVCIHPPARREVAVTVQEGWPVRLQNVRWNWSHAGDEERLFSSGDVSARLAIAVEDDRPLGTLTLSYGLHLMNDLPGKWSGWHLADTAAPPLVFDVGRCPGASEEAVPDPGDGGEEEPDARRDWCGVHDCLSWYCGGLHSQPCVEGECPLGTCSSGGEGDGDEDEGGEEPVTTPGLRYHTLRLDCNDSNANGIQDFQDSRRGLGPDPDWDQLRFPIAAGANGICCGCSDHGDREMAARLQYDSGIYVFASPPGGGYLRSLTSDQLPALVQGRSASTNFHDTVLVVESPGHHTLTNYYTVGALQFEPDVDRDCSITSVDRQQSEEIATNGWSLVASEKVFQMVNLRSEVRLPEGVFSLTLQSEGKSALYLPKRRYDSGSEWYYDCGFDTFGISLPPSAGFEPLLVSSGYSAQTVTSASPPVCNGDSLDWSLDFITPTNRVVWLQTSEPGKGRLIYSYKGKAPDGRSVIFTDVLHFRVFPPALIPDYDRNGIWDEVDEEAAIRSDRFNFWRNDDADGGWREKIYAGMFQGKPKYNYALHSPSDTPFSDIDEADAGDLVVGGVADWADFFPVKLNLKPLLDVYTPDDYQYVLESSGNYLNIWEPSLTPEKAKMVGQNGLIFNTNAIAATNNLSSTALCRVLSLKDELVLPQELINSLNNTVGTHALLFEGSQLTTENPALTLSVVDKQTQMKVFQTTAPIYIVPVEHMFHYRNLLSAAGNNDVAIYDTYNPAYAPWGQDETKQLFFAHGYNVGFAGVRAWGPEMFKRFFWSGSRAEFNLIHWYGFQTKIFNNIPAFDFHSNVVNAFNTAPELKELIVSKREEATQITLAGHSLGCMLVSAAVSLHEAPVDDLIIINAAVATEAYYDDEYTYFPKAMVHENWRQYVDDGIGIICASEWFRMFNLGDSRRKLTIRNLFKERHGVRTHQYYSTGEEVTGNPPEDLPVSDAPDYAWAVQELWKGRNPSHAGSLPGFVAGSTWMGWGFCGRLPNEPYAPELPLSSSQILEQVAGGRSLAYSPFFGQRPEEFLANVVPDEVQRQFALDSRFEILARGIPARTFSAGANPVPGGAEFEVSIDMNKFTREEGNTWIKIRAPNKNPENWQHNDLREMPFLCIRSLFDEIVETTHLEESEL